MAVTLFLIAFLFNSISVSGENEISTTFLPHSIIVFNILNPKCPGTARSTMSALIMKDDTCLMSRASTFKILIDG